MLVLFLLTQRHDGQLLSGWVHQSLSWSCNAQFKNYPSKKIFLIQTFRFSSQLQVFLIILASPLCTFPSFASLLVI